MRKTTQTWCGKRQSSSSAFAVFHAAGSFLLLACLLALCCASTAAPTAWAQEIGAAPSEAVAGSLDARAESLVRTVTLSVARFVEGAAALVIGLAAIRALGGYLGSLLGAAARRRAGSGSRTGAQAEDVRLRLGKSLALGLEFLLAADILKTAVAPTWNDIGQLAAIAVLRTGLNYFLEKELRDAEERRGSEEPGGSEAS